MIVARDPSSNTLRSYTRAITDTVWTRWPGVTFDTAYGLASPFTVLRLRPLATQIRHAGSRRNRGRSRRERQRRRPSSRQKSSSASCRRASHRRWQPTRTAEQLWRARSPPCSFRRPLPSGPTPQGRVAQAAGTLLTLGPDDQPAPWLEMTATYSGYDDPATVDRRRRPRRATLPTLRRQLRRTSARTAPRTSGGQGVTLRVRVFATAGEPATDAIVTVYGRARRQSSTRSSARTPSLRSSRANMTCWCGQAARSSGSRTWP